MLCGPYLQLHIAINVADLKGLVYDKYSITLQKTKKTIAFNLGEMTRMALHAQIKIREKNKEDYLFSSRTNKYAGQRLKEQLVSQTQYQRLVKWSLLSPNIGTNYYSMHNLRKNTSSVIYNAHRIVQAVRQLLGHSGIAATSAFLRAVNWTQQYSSNKRISQNRAGQSPRKR